MITLLKGVTPVTVTVKRGIELTTLLNAQCLVHPTTEARDGWATTIGKRILNETLRLNFKIKYTSSVSGRVYKALNTIIKVVRSSPLDRDSHRRYTLWQGV
jgi:hypothetical protein